MPDKVRVQHPLKLSSPHLESQVAQLRPRQVDRVAVQVFECPRGRGRAALGAGANDAEDGFVEVGLRGRERARGGEGAYVSSPKKTSATQPEAEAEASGCPEGRTHA